MENGNQITFMRLVTGEDVIAETTELDSSQRMVLINPLKVIYSITKDGNLSISLYDWIIPGISDHKQFQMDNTNILVTSPAGEKMIQYYKEYLLKGVEFIPRDSSSEEYDDLMDITDMDLEETKEILNNLFKKPKKGELH